MFGNYQQQHESLEPTSVVDSDDDDTVCLGESFFINHKYPSLTVTPDFDLTGQLVWPGARLLNEFVANNSELLQGYSTAIELGSGVGVTGILCSRFCRKVVLTDHNDEILKKNIELHKSSENPNSCAALSAEKLEWGNSDQLNYILQKHPDGFELVLGADIYILFFQQNSVPLLFDTVKQLLCQKGKEKCRFILAYISRSK
ncbi:hypothetical protein R6Q57_011338, partial [Mikania cordata]